MAPAPGRPRHASSWSGCAARAENLSSGEASGKPTLTKTGAAASHHALEYLLIRIGAVSLGALIGSSALASLWAGDLGVVGFAYLRWCSATCSDGAEHVQRTARQHAAAALNSLKTGYAIDRALETVAAKSQPLFEPSSSAWRLDHARTSVEEALSAFSFVSQPGPGFTCRDPAQPRSAETWPRSPTTSRHAARPAADKRT